MLAQMGYDGLFLGRVDYENKKQLFNEGKAEMIWHTSENIGRNSDIFTGVLYNVYYPPAGLCFDSLCQDDPIIDDELSSKYNLDKNVFRSYFSSLSLLIGVR